MQLVLVFIFGIVGDVEMKNHGDEEYYLGYPKYSVNLRSVVIIPLRFLLLNSTMIPISLKVRVTWGSRWLLVGGKWWMRRG
jgi:hypothetical protein